MKLSRRQSRPRQRPPPLQALIELRHHPVGKGAETGCSQSVGGGLRLGMGEWGGCLSGMLWFPLWCAYVSLWLGGLVCGSCVFRGFRVSLVWLRSALMRSRSTLCEVPLEDIWRRPVPSSRAGRGEVCLVWVARG